MLLQWFSPAVDDLLGVGAVEVVDLHVHGYRQVLPHLVGVGPGPDLHLLGWDILYQHSK